MNFNLSEEQTLIRDSIERFVADNYEFDKRNATVAMEHGFDPVIVIFPVLYQVESQELRNYPQRRLIQISEDQELPWHKRYRTMCGFPRVMKGWILEDKE